MTKAELRKIAEYVDEIVHGLHEWDYRRPQACLHPSTFDISQFDIRYSSCAS